jgi:hypothetical protein
MVEGDLVTSTRSGARLPQQNLTGLGAVGGPQGVAAGGLRIILEFLTQYDPAAVKQLEADLATLNADLNKFNAQAAKRANDNAKLAARIQKAEDKVEEAGAAARTRRFKRELADIRTLAKDPAQKTQAQARLNQLILDIQAAGITLNKTQLKDLTGLLGLDAKLLKGKQAQAAQQAVINALVQQQLAAEEQLAGFQRLKGGIGGRLGSLAIGAIGATIGGTILAGTVFMAMQAAVEAVGTAIEENIIDPTKRAREAMSELGQAMNALEGATDFEKAGTFLKSLGLEDNEANRRLLEQAAAFERVNAIIETRKQVVEATGKSEEVHKKQIEDVKNQLIEEAKANGNLVYSYQWVGSTSGKVLRAVANEQYYLMKATEEWQSVSEIAAEQARSEAFAKQSLAEANNRAAFAQQLLTAQIQAGIQRASDVFDQRIEGIADESARTRALQARLSRAQNRSGGASNARELANIAEERALVLLRMRLRDLGTAINIEKYEGKFRLEAINAKVRALQKEGEAQDRVNRLLALQYQMSKEIRREQGESIKDYLERRAQENREMLAERDQLRRDAQISALNEQKERLEDEIKLRELAEQAKQTAMQGTENAYVKSLEKQLQASKDRDKKEAEARKRALEKQKKELVDAANEALEIATAEQTATWKTTLFGMNNIQDLNRVSGHLQGLYRGKSAIEALVKSFGVPEWAARPFLTQLNAQIAAYRSAVARLSDKAAAGPPGTEKIRLASGGAFMLKNSTSPFGQNVQFGEEGSELGVVLSTKVVDQLRKMNFPQQIGPFYVQGSDNPLRDQFALKRLVREAVAEVLR